MKSADTAKYTVNFYGWISRPQGAVPAGEELNRLRVAERDRDEPHRVAGPPPFRARGLFVHAPPASGKRLHDIGCDLFEPDHSTPEYLGEFVAAEVKEMGSSDQGERRSAGVGCSGRIKRALRLGRRC
jgi:hypothetical protein